MAKKCTYKLKFRRRREKRTDYAKRLALVKSGLPRLVIRRTNQYIISQVIKFDPKGDITLVHINSSRLKKLGWN
ncbi:MAG: 50S ribosomal protein L18, partial [Candidatus Iainarchaeum archaeon]